MGLQKERRVPARHHFVQERTLCQVDLHPAVGASIVGASTVGAFSGTSVAGALHLQPHSSVKANGYSPWASRTVQDANMTGRHDFHHKRL